MRLFSDDDRQARAALIQARQHLTEAAEVATGRDDDRFLDANDAVIDAERALPAWKRLDIDAGIYDHRGPDRTDDDTDEV